jgi:hypothetical protein
VLRLKLKPGRDGDVVAYYAERDILGKAMSAGGCTAAEIHVRLPERDEVVVSALWRSIGDYDAWLASAGRAVDSADLEVLLAPESVPVGEGETYDVVASVPAVTR